jgi:hypothetical protein
MRRHSSISKFKVKCFHGGYTVAWIKMRTNISRFPKTLALATELHKNREALDSLCDGDVTVTLACLTRVTVASLLELWGTIQESIDDQNFVALMTLDHIDSITEISGFGVALEKVEWVEVVPKGLVFHNFREHNTPTKERGDPVSGAERTRRWRERKRGNGGVTAVTSRDGEQSRVDILKPPTPFTKGGRRKRGGEDVPMLSREELQRQRIELGMEEDNGKA